MFSPLPTVETELYIMSLVAVIVALCLCCRVSAEFEYDLFGENKVIDSHTDEELIDDFDSVGDPINWSNWNEGDHQQRWHHSFTGDPSPFGRHGKRPPPHSTGIDGFIELVPINSTKHSGDPAHLHSKYVQLQPNASLEILYWNTAPPKHVGLEHFPPMMFVQLYSGGHTTIYRFPEAKPDDDKWRTAVIPLNITITTRAQV